VVVNDGELHLTVELPGTSVQPDSRVGGPSFLIDDLSVQVVSVSRRQLGAAEGGKHGVELSRAFAAWEAAGTEKLLSGKLETHEVAVPAGNGAALSRDGLLWWYAVPARAGAGLANVAFSTVEAADHVVGLTARSSDGLEPLDVTARLTQWMASLRISAGHVSAEALAAQIRARSEAGETCQTAPDRTPTLGVDRRLRLDGAPEAERDAAIAIAAAHGGVERRTVSGRRHYWNHVYRFEFDYPGAGWEDGQMLDVSPRACDVNILTPLLLDPEEGREVRNEVRVMAAWATADFGRDRLHELFLDAMRKQGARDSPARTPLFDGAIGTTYAMDANGIHYVGEVATFRRGDMLYSISFNSRRGTAAEGRKHLMRFLAGLRFD
jgi:hypothetical protein